MIALARRAPHATAVALAAPAAAAFALASAPAALRAPVVLGFLVLGPGTAFVPLLALGDAVAELAVAVGVSLALDVAVETTMTYAGAWSPVGSLLVLAAIALAGVALQLARAGGAR
jgi:hypothetical protein